MRTKIITFIILVIGTVLFYQYKSVANNSVSEEAFRSHMHLAFDSYSNGYADGIEEDAITGESTRETDMECGLDNFDKSLFKSDYSIQKIEDSKYGGKIGYLFFSSKPDRTFWVWIYNLGDNDGPEYVVRAFCKG